MKPNIKHNTNIGWTDAISEDHISLALEAKREAYEFFKQSICHGFTKELPPLKHFLGWTPMKEFINRCKPFIPMERAKPFIAQSILSDDLIKAVEQIQLLHLEHLKWIQKTLMIPKDKIGHERR